MAVKSWFLSVVDTATHKPVIHKMFFTAPEMNKFIKEQNILEEYKKPQYYIVKENYWCRLIRIDLSTEPKKKNGQHKDATVESS